MMANYLCSVLGLLRRMAVGEVANVSEEHLPPSSESKCVGWRVGVLIYIICFLKNGERGGG
jgi:hypothetical protein